MKEHDIKFQCPHCGQHLSAPVDMEGQTVPCPNCGGQLTVASPNAGVSQGKIDFLKSDIIAISVSAVVVLCIVVAFVVYDFRRNGTSQSPKGKSVIETVRNDNARSSVEESTEDQQPKEHAPRNPTDIERDYALALDALLRRDGQKRDIVKAYRGFTAALDKGYAPAATAMAHIGWTALYSDKQSEERRALENAGINVQTLPIVSRWTTGIDCGSRLAEFELGFFQLQAGNTTEGLPHLEKAAAEGCYPASIFLRTLKSSQESSSLSPQLILRLLIQSEETLSTIWGICELELKKEYLLSLQK